MRSTARNPACLPSRRAPRGRWTAACGSRSKSGGLQVVDPGKIAGNRIPPPVRDSAGRRGSQGVMSRSPGCVCLALTRDLEIDYTALSLSIPEKVRFRYRLEGARRRLAGRRNAPGSLFHQSEAWGAIASASSPRTTTASGTSKARRSTSPSCPRSTRPVPSCCCRSRPWRCWRGRLIAGASARSRHAWTCSSRSGSPNGRGSPRICTTRFCKVFSAPPCSSTSPSTSFPRTRRRNRA